MHILDPNRCNHRVSVQELEIMSLLPLCFQVFPERILSLRRELEVKHEVRALCVDASKLVTVRTKLDFLDCGLLACQLQVGGVEVAERGGLVESLVELEGGDNALLVPREVDGDLGVRADGVGVLIMVNSLGASFVQDVE